MRPNLLLFMTDQQRVDSIGAYGSAAARTPNLDAFAARGVRFTNAFSQHSACSQSRVSMMTGWYPHVAGHRTLDSLLQPWEPNVLRTLRAAGYFVAQAGVRGDSFASGVTAESVDWFGFTTPPSLAALGAAHADVYPEGHRLHHAFLIGRLVGPDHFGPDDAAIRTAIELLEHGLPEPFVLVIDLFAPHPPFAVEDPWYSLVDRADVAPPVPPMPGKPGFMHELHARAGLERLEPADWAEIAATYLGMVAKVDDQFGQVQAALARAGVADRTVTFFHTDHGEYLGDFGLVEKWPSGLDSCLLQNPLMVAGPGVAEGALCDSFVEMLDLPATICDLAETEVGHVQFGRSLVPVFTEPSLTHRERAFSEGGFRIDEAAQNEQADFHPYRLKSSLQQERPELVGRAVCVRTPEWTHVHRLYESDELYDRRADPRETTNLVDQPQHAEVCRDLRAELLDWLVATSDVIRSERDPRMDASTVDAFLGQATTPLPQAPPDTASGRSNPAGR